MKKLWVIFLISASVGANEWDEKFKPYAGAVVGVLKGDRVQYFSYGTIRLGQNTAPNEKTIFEIGSVTKVFSGLLLAVEVVEGRKKLEAPVRSCPKHQTTGLCFEGEPIRWIHLATHTSGLPRLPDLKLEDPLNPYGKYSARQLEGFLKVYKLQVKPGTKTEYSNLGANVMAYELWRAREFKNYEEHLLAEISKPLELKDTRVWLSDEQKKRFATGYFEGEAVPYWERDKQAVLLGSGAIRSTASDLIQFLKAQLGMLTYRNSKAVELSQKRELNWQVLKKDDEQIFWHNGGTAGFSSFVAFNPKQKTAVVILANSMFGDPSRSLDDVGFKILNQK